MPPNGPVFYGPQFTPFGQPNAPFNPNYNQMNMHPAYRGSIGFAPNYLPSNVPFGNVGSNTTNMDVPGNQMTYFDAQNLTLPKDDDDQLPVYEVDLDNAKDYTGKNKLD